MTLSSLLVCVDDAAAEVLRRVLDELSIKVESCPDFTRAGIRLAQDRFDLVLIDGPVNSEVAALLRETKLSRLNDSTLAVAIIPAQDSIREMFSLGVNFVLYKPVAYDRALSSLRAAHALMRKEKRKAPRATVHAHATIDYANVEREKATLIDLASDGMSMQFGKKLPPTNKIYFQFQLPGQSASVRLSGQVVWQDWNGRAGVHFVDVPKTSRRLLTDFLGAHLNEDSRREYLPDVTVEMEDLLQPLLVGAGGEIQSDGKETKSAAAHSATQTQTDPDNRRSQERYSCRLGAQVYRTGITVPHHCCLTDLSSGGCYLEVSLPFTMGTSVEINVRTHEMKLSLRGTVQASHPGYGMGVAFELKNKFDHDEVQKLTNFVAADAAPGH